MARKSKTSDPTSPIPSTSSRYLIYTRTRPAKDELLTNGDVLSQIVSFLVPDLAGTRDSLKASRKELLNVALACSSFKDPALDALWRSLESLVPLVRLISGVALVDQKYVREFTPDVS